MQNGCLSLSIFVTREEGMWKHVAAQAFGPLMPEINSMWSSYENALNSPCAAWCFFQSKWIHFLQNQNCKIGEKIRFSLWRLLFLGVFSGSGKELSKVSLQEEGRPIVMGKYDVHHTFPGLSSSSKSKSNLNHPAQRLGWISAGRTFNHGHLWFISLLEYCWYLLRSCIST